LLPQDTFNFLLLAFNLSLFNYSFNPIHIWS